MNELKPQIHSLQGRRFDVNAILGIGGFGITYDCYDTATGGAGRVAIKEYMPDAYAIRDPATGQVRARPDRVEAFRHGMIRFEEEANILRKLSRQVKEVVNVWYPFEENGTPYYVMDFLNGVTLKQLARSSGGKLSFETARWAVGNAGIALEQIHRLSGIFHRDISPENIMVLPDCEIRIIDFGSAKSLAVDADQKFSVVLKPGFAPPEQYSSTKAQGSFTDVYALAGTFYCLATGVMVPAAPDRLSGMGYRPLCELVPECPKEVSDAVDRALDLDSRTRTQTMWEFIEGIRARMPDAAHAPSEQSLRQSAASFNPAAQAFTVPPEAWQSVRLATSTFAARWPAAPSSFDSAARQDTIPPDAWQSASPPASGSAAWWLAASSSSDPSAQQNTIPPNAWQSAPPPASGSAAWRPAAPSSFDPAAPQITIPPDAWPPASPSASGSALRQSSAPSSFDPAAPQNTIPPDAWPPAPPPASGSAAWWLAASSSSDPSAPQNTIPPDAWQSAPPSPSGSASRQPAASSSFDPSARQSSVPSAPVFASAAPGSPGTAPQWAAILDAQRTQDLPDRSSSQKIPAAWLEVVQGACAGKRFPLPPGQVLRVGRSFARSEITLFGHPEISGVHLLLLYQPQKGGVYMIDDSKNGIYYRGIRLKKGEKYRLRSGDQIGVGGMRCVIEIRVVDYA